MIIANKLDSSRLRLHPFLILALLGFIAMLPAFFLGHIIGHSSILNVNWAEGFAGQLRAGELYPRWLPAMTGGGGSPVFYFYGPLPFFIAAPFVLLTGNAAIAVIFASTLMLILSGCACYILCRNFVAPRAALLGAAVYMLLPYHFDVDIWFRSAFGEQASFVFMPLAIASIYKLKDDNRSIIFLALSFAGLVFSHIPSTLLFTPILAILILAFAFQQNSNAVIFRAALAAGLAGGLTAIYLLPAVALQSMIQQWRWAKFLPEDNLLFTIQTVAVFKYFLIPIWLVILLVALLSFFVLSNRVHFKMLWPWILVGFIVILACQDFTAPLWAKAGLFKVIQFPWRALSILDLTFAVLVSYFWENERKSRYFLSTALVIVIVLPMVLAVFSQLQKYQTAPDGKSEFTVSEMVQFDLKSDAAEYLPSCMIVPEALRERSMTKANAELNKIAIVEPSSRPIYYFPFLSAKLNGKVLPMTCDPATGYVKFESPQVGEISFTKTALPIEVIAGRVSSISAVLILILSIFIWKRRKEPVGRTA